MAATDPVADQLCLACGLCCDSTLFKDVELQPGDDAVRLQSLGLPIRITPRTQAASAKSRTAKTPPAKFPQPCAALCPDCRCRIYPARPARCQEFECALFKSVAAGRVEATAALRPIRTARKRAEKARRLLRELGDREESTALSIRFRRMKRRLDAGGAEQKTAELFGQLSLAVHELNLLLSGTFYPGRPAAP